MDIQELKNLVNSEQFKLYQEAYRQWIEDAILWISEEEWWEETRDYYLKKHLNK